MSSLLTAYSAKRPATTAATDNTSRWGNMRCNLSVSPNSHPTTREEAPIRHFNPLLWIPLAKFIFHMVTYRGYGLFRDEYYYLACSHRLAWGYVDHPPLSIGLLWLHRSLFGESALALRLLPALAGGATVYVVGCIARQAGGGRWAQSLAMLAVATTYLSVFHSFSMNAFDVLCWSLVALLIQRIVKADSLRERAQDSEPRALKLWTVLGVVLGLGLLNKLSVLWLGAGLALGLLCTPQRRLLSTRGPWVAGIVAIALFIPHLVWQFANDFPTLEFIENATSEKMVAVSPWQFLSGQIESTLVMLPLLVAAAVALSFGHLRRFRILGWVYVGVFTILLFSGASRAGYLAPAYTWLLALGAVSWESWGRRYPRLALVGAGSVLALSIAVAPLSMPLLSVDRYVAYAESLGEAPSTEERKSLGVLPQNFADRFGWEELAIGVEQAIESLPKSERAGIAVFSPNYGNAGAIEYFARRRGQSIESLSGHNNYWLWGPGNGTHNVLLVVGSSRERLEQRFADVRLASTVRCDLCMPYESERNIWIARGPRSSLENLWSELKHYD